MLTTILLTLNLLLFGETGKIKGTVVDKSNGEPLFGVTVQVKETTKGTISDFDGKFDLVLDPGVYDLQISFISYTTLYVSDIEIQPGQIVYFDNLQLEESVTELNEIVVSAEAIKDNESALQALKRKSTGMIDGLSAASFRKIGDSDAAGAVKRVTGVSVEGGKYVYVRGLGDRYTKTTLNGVDIPGLDPDRNSIQMDIFPTTLLNNLIVSKTSLAEMPADFTGGIVDIETKDFPEERLLNVSIGVGYNPAMHFNDSFLEIPTLAQNFPSRYDPYNIPFPLNGSTDQEVEEFIQTLGPVLAPRQTTNLPDYKIGVTSGNYKNLGVGKLGYILDVNHRKSTKYYKDYRFGEYVNSVDSGEFSLDYSTIQDGVVAETDQLTGTLAGLTYKTQASKIKLVGMHLYSLNQRVARFNIDNSETAVGQSGYIGESHNLETTSRYFTNTLLSGKHVFDNSNWEIEWKLSPSLSTIKNPDIRKTAFTLSRTGGRPRFNSGAAGNPSRIWRDLNEINFVGKVDITRSYNLFGEEAELKFGVQHVYKQRDYEILFYTVQFFGAQPEWTGDPSEVLVPENTFPTGPIYYASGNNDPNPNAYKSNVNNFAFYISNEFQVSKDLKAILGLRAEDFVQRHTGRDVEFASFGTGNNLDNEKVLNALDFFPSANLIYSLNDDQNLRGSYSRTIARPSFKELSFAQILDPVSNRIFNGGLYQYEDWDGGLSETRIDNLDLRWELFLPGAQIFSISAFYKFFNDPIELVRIPEAQTTNEFQPRNVGDGRVYGLEFEFMKNLDFLTKEMKNFTLNGNITIIHSSITMTEIEYDSRASFLSTVGKNTRQMQGQAPYIINAGIGYENFETGLDAGLFYNIKGETLTVVGGGLFPDVFSEPFHSLNFNLNKSFGVNQRTVVNLSVTNLLDDDIREVYNGRGTGDETFTHFNPRRSFSMGVNYFF